MANFDSGVKAYIFGEYTIKISFPVDFKDNADVLCCPCEPYLRISISFTEKSISSL